MGRHASRYNMSAGIPNDQMSQAFPYASGEPTICTTSGLHTITSGAIQYGLPVKQPQRHAESGKAHRHAHAKETAHLDVEYLERSIYVTMTHTWFCGYARQHPRKGQTARRMAPSNTTGSPTVPMEVVLPCFSLMTAETPKSQILTATPFE